MSASGREGFYDGIAETFDVIMNPYDLRRRIEIVLHEALAAEDLAGKRVLDVGCGTGWFSRAAAERGAEVVSLDIGHRLLKVAARRGANMSVCGSALQLCFGTGTFDTVLSSECIEHTPAPLSAAREMVRVLRPGGRLVITTPNRLWYPSLQFANALGIRAYEGLENWVFPGQLRRTLEREGLAVDTMRGFHLWPFVFERLNPILRWFDRYGTWPGFRYLYVNACLSGTKRGHR